MNGYEFVEKVLAHTNYDVGPLLEIARNSENEWLELKAASGPEDSEFRRDKKGRQENKWDYRWDVSKALFGLANASGGALLLGVSEGRLGGSQVPEPVSLEASGFTGDRDKFTRDLNDWILQPRDGWKTGTSGHWQCPDPHGMFKPRWGRLQGRDVVVILVRPREPVQGWLGVECRDNGEVREEIYCRRPGDVGQTWAIPVADRVGWWQARSIEQGDLNALFNQFLERWNAAGKQSQALIENALGSYAQAIAARLDGQSLERTFSISSGATVGDSVGWEPEANKREDGGEADHRRRDTVHRHRHPREGSVLSLLEGVPRLVVLGEPGAGKSTSFARYVLRGAKAWRPSVMLPVLIRLYEYGEGGLRGLILRNLPGLRWIDIESDVAKGRLAILFDGLNECPSAHYEACSQELKGLLADYPDARVAISSRLTDNPSQLGLPTFEIRSMNTAQQTRLLGEMLGDKDRAEAVLSSLGGQGGGALVANTPILLRMLAEVVAEAEGALRSRAKLYGLFFEHWHQRESEKNRQNGSPSLWSLNRVKDALSLLAFEMRAGGEVAIRMGRARSILVPILGDDVGRFVDRMVTGALLVTDDQDDHLHFPHETLLEYLAGEYLARQPEALRQELLMEGSGRRAASWSLPLVFALELMRNPPQEFIERAWRVEPLLVAAALQDSRLLARLPIHLHEDLWLSGFLRAMRNEALIPESRLLVLASRFPPKYPFSEKLVSALRGSAFWYALRAHPEGQAREQRITALLLDRDEVWMELLPHACANQEALRQRLSPAQKVLAGVPEAGRDVDVGLLTLRELCSLTWHRLVSEQHFLDGWRGALDRCRGHHVDDGLVALLATNPRLGKKINTLEFDDFSTGEIERLRDISGNWSLSLKVLNILVRQRVVSAEQIRSEPDRVRDIVARISANNAFRLMKSRVLVPEDFSRDRYNAMIQGMTPAMRAELLKQGVVKLDGTSAAVRGRVYTDNELQSAAGRKTIEDALAGQRYEVIVEQFNPDKQFGFVRCEKLGEAAFFHADRIGNPQNKSILSGDRLSVKLEVAFNKAKKRYGYVVKNGELLK